MRVPEKLRHFDICVSKTDRTSSRYTIYNVTTALAKAHGTRLFRDPLVRDVYVIERNVREWFRRREDKAWTLVDDTAPNLP